MGLSLPSCGLLSVPNCWQERNVPQLPGSLKKGGDSWWSLRLIYRGRCYSRAAGLDQTGVDRLGDLGGVGGTLDGGTEVLVHERLGDLG